MEFDATLSLNKVKKISLNFPKHKKASRDKLSVPSYLEIPFIFGNLILVKMNTKGHCYPKSIIMHAVYLSLDLH
jgi:hypothetical protein